LKYRKIIQLKKSKNSHIFIGNKASKQAKKVIFVGYSEPIKYERRK